MLNKAPKNILVFRNDRLGEFILTLPAIEALKEAWPKANLTLVVNSALAELAGALVFVDKVLVWEADVHKFSQIYKFATQIRKYHFDLCVIFNPSKEFNIISFLAGIPIRLGYNHKWPFLLTYKVTDNKYLEECHEVEYNLRFLEAIGLKPLRVNPSLKMKIESGQIVNLENYIVLHPWTSDMIKQWSLESFVMLAKKIALETEYLVKIVGGKEALFRREQLFKGLPDKVVNLTGKTNLLELAIVLKKARLLISCDSGPVHLACAIGVPVIVIFRNDIPGKTPLRWGPVGSSNTVIQKNSLLDISVEEVFAKVKEALAK